MLIFIILSLEFLIFLFFFFFNDTATTEIYTLSLHDALPISRAPRGSGLAGGGQLAEAQRGRGRQSDRSEEHTSELQSRQYLVCRLLLEKKKNILDASSPVRRIWRLCTR